MAFQVEWHEDSDATVLGRITARNGSGSATGVNGEGNWLQQADVTSITWKIFDLQSATPEIAATSGTVTISTSVLDTPVATNVIWVQDAIGYNFIHDLAASNFPTGGRDYRLEYVATLTGGEVFHGVYQGQAVAISSS